MSSSDGGILAEGETSSETSDGSNGPPCDLGLVERLLRTHPVWFLAGIRRAGAVHLLQGKEEGVSESRTADRQTCSKQHDARNRSVDESRWMGDS